MSAEKMRYYSLVLAAICVAVFVIQSFIIEFTGLFVLVSSDVLARPWILVTSIFLHGSLSHLVFNMFALVLFGLILEKFIGSKKFLAVFFVSGIAASIAALAYPSSLGASGAIYGILGTLAAIKPKMIVWTYDVPMPMVVAALFYLVLDLAGLFFPTNIANAAHIAGLAAGVAIGLYLREPGKEKISKADKMLNEKQLEQWEDEWM